MSEINLLRDASFLRQLDNENIKVYYVKILILDNNELPIRAIEGRVSNGSISINGDSNVRRAGSLTFLAEEELNDLTDIDNLLSMNKKIKILIGIENNIDDIHDKIIWFNQGIFVITQPSLQHNTNSVTISLQFKDKMCLLNGECGGGLPTSITFHEYDQIIGIDNNGGQGYADFPLYPNNYTIYIINKKYYMWDTTEGWSEIPEKEALKKINEKEVIHVPQRIFDIIQTLVCNFGNESIAKILINDVPLELKASVRYVGGDPLYYNSDTGVYTLDEEETAAAASEWQVFNFNEDCGYIYTDFTYPGELISGIGENICSVLDKIKTTLGNYEYFYDIEGNFVFQEKKNYLNTQYNPIIKLDENGFLLDKDNYYVDFSHHTESIYTFDEGSALINAYSNTPNYANIKNDYHIWGKNKGTDSKEYAIHYHIAVKEKPLPPYSTWSVVAEKDKDGNKTGKIHLAGLNEQGYDYVPYDWRAEIYMQGLQKKALYQRPDIYEQELLDLFDSIYDFSKEVYKKDSEGKIIYDEDKNPIIDHYGEFKVDIVNHPNDLKYWVDYIEPVELFDISTDVVGSKIYSYQQDKIKKMYNTDIPNVVMIDAAATAVSQASIILKCEEIGQPYSRVSKNIYDNIAIGTIGHTAQETARDLIYQYTNYNATISITSIPIYYLNVNERITVQDRASGIFGDYIVNSINLPLDARSTMSIQASKVLERM